eukprot:TRINITY_DN17075_c0_g1_i3.p2 TRINITY_DN17075_c0_g1~~TRINITY_DN17075_c0_g1_i3.p2  ORF type:complete len:139 (+),score=24.70 TRINITY_DN17075_c0_g1_i3:503-919(+)
MVEKFQNYRRYLLMAVKRDCYQSHGRTQSQQLEEGGLSSIYGLYKKGTRPQGLSKSCEEALGDIMKHLKNDSTQLHQINLIKPTNYNHQKKKKKKKKKRNSAQKKKNQKKQKITKKTQCKNHQIPNRKTKEKTQINAR